MKSRLILNALTIAALTLGAASLAQAQATRTWVSGVGDDLNPCSRTAPCKTWAGAFSKTFINGEIDALDPGGYGTLNATKSITIDGGTGSGWGSTLNAATNGFTVNIAVNVNDPLRQVILKHLSINGSGSSGAIGTRTGVRGVNYIQGSALIVEDCQIFNQTTVGIDVNLTNNGILKVTNTSIESIGGDGIRLATTVGQVLATIENCRIQDCASDGIEAGTHVRAAIRGSVITNTTTTGIRTSSTDAILNIDDVFVSYTGTGMQASASSTINVSDSIVAQCATGVNANGGSMVSFQGNSLISNTTPGTFLPINNKT
ncbi:MAG: hypothetical protein QOD75_1832 [Blastocatellia bacterium]|jgi:hypothetical protein|nr:hypothetical protein [Blastocatellia bacterium]